MVRLRLQHGPALSYQIDAALLFYQIILSTNMKKIAMALVGGLLFVLCYQHTNRQTDFLKKQEKPAATGSITNQSAAKVPEEMRNSPLFRLVKT